MASKLDMPTNEGSLAIARSLSSGAMLKISMAKLVTITNPEVITVENAAKLSWATNDEDHISLQDMISSKTYDMVCQSYLPSVYAKDGKSSETGEPITALDMEFTCIPTENISYNALAVLADMYYAFAPFKTGIDYKVGATVWQFITDRYYYFRCIDNVTDSSVYPMSDAEHWEQVTTEAELEPNATESGQVQFMRISEDNPVLLYISKLTGTNTIVPGMEIDYKVRVYIECGASSVEDHIVFDTLGPEFMASAQLDALAYYAQSMRAIRDVAMNKK